MGLLDRLFGVNEYQIPNFVPNTENRSLSSEITPPSRSNLVINEKTALSLVPVTRSIAVLETAIMQIPVDVYRGNEKIAAPVWLETPDIQNNISQAEFVGNTLTNMALFGNAFWQVTRGARGVANVRNLHPATVSVVLDERGRKTYSVNGSIVPSDSIAHIKLWSKPGVNDILGEGPIQRHRQILLSALDLQHYSDNWFRLSAVPTGLLTTTEFLSEDVAISNKKAFIESQQDRSVAVLSSGLKYEAVNLNPEEAQFLENQKFINRQIANMFGVPSTYLGFSLEGVGMTYTNGNEDRVKLYEDGLQQYLVRIEQALSDLLPRGQKARFNLTGFLRPNQKNRFESYAIALQNGFMTINEARELENLLPLTEADIPEVTIDEQTV